MLNNFVQCLFYEIKTPRILTPRDFSNTEAFQTTVFYYESLLPYRQNCVCHDIVTQFVTIFLHKKIVYS